ncbi:hypothetical protein [Actinomadura sp. 3N407]|uniref:hypothetical protein n=1 Tax=Actinomadura sp. 3N407 TaxID=3457423 RepID=UPI003FCDB181
MSGPFEGWGEPGWSAPPDLEDADPPGGAIGREVVYLPPALRVSRPGVQVVSTRVVAR